MTTYQYLYQNPNLSVEERANDLLTRMDIDEKMGQIVCYFPRMLSEYDELANDYSHGVGTVSALEMRSLDSLEDAAKFQREIQEKAMALSKHQIPAIFHMEGLCGAYVQGAASFPSGIGRGSSWDPELEKEIGKIVGRQERAIGISQVFAPVLDISRDSRFGRQGETYGEDPVLASAMGVAYTKGVQAEKTGNLQSECVAKTSWAFMVRMEGSMEPTVIFHQDLCRKFTGSPSKLLFQRPICGESCLVMLLSTGNQCLHPKKF